MRRKIILAIAIPVAAALGRLVAGRVRASGRSTGADRVERAAGAVQRLRRPRGRRYRRPTRT